MILSSSTETKLLACIEGYRTRKQVSVKSVHPGVIHTRIRAKKEGIGPRLDSRSPVGKIQGLLQEGALYDRLRVIGGAEAGEVLGTKNKQKPTSPLEIAKGFGVGSAIISGGFFVHKKNLETDTGGVIEGVGLPVGASIERSDFVPISEPWQEYYGQVNLGDKLGLCSAPMMKFKGKAVHITDNDCFKYRIEVDGQGQIENPLNKRAGALTHCGDNNERAAISIIDADVLMHTLTASGKRTQGVKMRAWQCITSIGCSVRLNDRGLNEVSSLNLDGGGSIYMGVVKPEEILLISRGGNADEDFRSIVNMIGCKPKRIDSKNSSKPISLLFWSKPQ